MKHEVGFDFLFFTVFAKLDIWRDLSFQYESLIDLVVIILLCIGLFVVVVTPLFLLCCWTIYSVDYVKKYRTKFSIQKWFTGSSELDLKDVTYMEWLRYRSTYSRMVGFGFSIFAYGTACTLYLVQNFKRIESGMVEYFSFPFKVVRNLDRFQSKEQLDPIDQMMFPYEEVWAEMIFIIVISAIFFLAGYIFAAFLVDYRLRKLKKSDRQTVKMNPNKEMFAIKANKSLN